MRIVAALLALIGFVGLAVFGVYGMINHGHSGFAACLASLTQNGFCPQANAFASASFHINSFKFFSNAPMAGVSAMLIILAALFATAPSVFAASPDQAQPVAVDVSRGQLNEIFKNSLQPFKKEKNFWSALHENSPTETAASFRSSIAG